MTIFSTKIFTDLFVFNYEKKIQELANTRFYPTGIYRKTFLTYGNELKINIYTLKRLVFHTQNYFDVTSGYIKTHRQVLLDASEKIANYLNSYISPKLIQPEPSKQIIEISDVSIDKDIIDELTAQYGEDATRKTNDLIRIALALKTKGLALPLGLHVAFNFGNWALGFKGKPGIWQVIVENGYDAQVNNIGLAAYVFAMGLAITGICIFYKKEKLF